MNTRLTTILEAEGLTDLLHLFLDKGITDSILDKMDSSILQSIGVIRLGDRMRLLANFKNNSQAIMPKSNLKLISILESEKLMELLPTFFEHGFADSVLKQIGDTELEFMGINLIGHKLRLMSKFSKLPWNLRIKHWGTNEQFSISEVRSAIPGLDLSTARALVRFEPLPFVLYQDIPADEAQTIKARWEKYGADIELF
jgi:SAM domain (Sterile alpha motif)